MVKPGIDVFLRLNPGSNKRVLSPGSATAVDDDSVTAEFENTQLVVMEGQDLLLYFEHRQQFMQQAARVREVHEREPKLVVELELTGDPVSAESRQSYRVSTIGSTVTCKLNDEDDCPVLDVSGTGFSLWASQERQVGDLVDVVLHFEDRELRGRACVQSTAPHKGELKRYGLHAVSDPSGDLKGELIRVSMALQRAQLARLSGS